MSSEEDKDLVRWFVGEVWKRMNPERVNQFVAPDMIDHSSRGSGGRP